MSEKYLHFRKRKKYLARTFFSHPVEVTKSMHFGNIFMNYVFLKDMYKNLKEIGIIQAVSKLIIFVNCEFLSFTAVCTNKKIEVQNFEYSFSCEKLNFSVKHITILIF